MQIRWLAILGCLLITACSDTATDEIAKNSSESANADSAEPINSATKVEVKAEPNPEPKSPSEQFEAAKSRFENARSEFMAAYNKASKADKQEMVSEYPKPEKYVDEFVRIAAEHPESDAAFDSLLWVASNMRSGDHASQAYDTLFTDHIENEGLASICMGLSYSLPSQQVEDRLNSLIEKSPHDSVKAAATYSLAKYLAKVEGLHKSFKEKTSSRSFDDETTAYLEAFEPQSQVVETMFQTLISDYASLKPYERSKKNYKTMAESALFEINFLSIGKMAPDIEGVDFDGTSFKLSDYRGKVVVLDFWGDW